MTVFGDVLGSTALDSQVIMSINNFRKGATAPADGTLGTTPTVPTILFAATAELLSAGIVFPLDFDRTVDIRLVLIWSLAAAQANNDTLDVTVNYTVPIVGTPGSGPGKTSTQVTGQITATTAEGLAIGDTYAMSINLARGDANNPYTSQSAVGLLIELGLTNVTGIASAHLLLGCIAYQRLQ